jgi:hypothetical protein
LLLPFDAKRDVGRSWVPGWALLVRVYDHSWAADTGGMSSYGSEACALQMYPFTLNRRPKAFSSG